MRALYWFRRDLRLADNRALLEAVERADEVVAVYVVDPDVLGRLEMTPGDPRFAFLVDALRALSSRVRLHVLYERTAEAFERLLDRYRFDAVYTSSPLTWTEEELVGRVAGVCQRFGVKLVEVLDNVLVDPRSVGDAANFTAFYRRWRGLVDARVLGEVPASKFSSVDEPTLDEAAARYGWASAGAGPWRVDRLAERLSYFDFGRYAALKDYPYLDGTSRLSPFIGLGVVSVREVYRRASVESEEFVRQLAWREFYYYLRFRYPWMRDLELKPRMRGIRWENDDYLIRAFVEGRTGYPIVDAGVRQLRAESWVHNRVRLILASFLAKDLHVDWRIGESIFRRHLVDYDEVLNVGNWQWAASVGVDPLPLRVFNPVAQSKRYDPMCLYIKKYVPELEGHDCGELHDPLSHRIRGYYEPIVDHYERVSRFRSLVG